MSAALEPEFDLQPLRVKQVGHSLFAWLSGFAKWEACHMAAAMDFVYRVLQDLGN
jgi:hypothetical protein